MHFPNWIKLETKRKRTVAIGVILFSFVTFLSAFHFQTEHAPEALPKFFVTSVWKANEEITKQYVGQIRAIQHIELRALERGYLTEIFVDEGQFVHKGQRMFQIMPMLNQAELKKAGAESDLARIEFENTQNLANDNIVSANELALAKAKYDKAKAAQELAKVHLDMTVIKAPFDGIMGRFNVRRGSLVQEGELLTTLSDNSKMWVYFNVSEGEYLDYRAHDKDPNALIVKLQMANGKMFDSLGKVETVEADFNNETGNIAFRATFPNSKGILRHGETGNIQVTIPLDNALIIPQKSTYDILDKKYVYVIDKENTVKSREVVIGAELPHLYVVKSGLSEGERILFDGLGKVRPEAKIDVDYLEPSKAIARLDVPTQ